MSDTFHKRRKLQHKLDNLWGISIILGVISVLMLTVETVRFILTGNVTVWFAIPILAGVVTYWIGILYSNRIDEILRDNKV